MTGGASGPGRRLTAEQEAKGAEMFAAGATDRQVADALGIGAGTANRLRHRTAATGSADAAAEPMEMTEVQPDPLAPDAAVREAEAIAEAAAVFDRAADYAGQLAAAIGTHEELSGLITTHEARAAAARTGLGGLQRQKLEILARGGDALPLRARIRDAEDDLADAETSIELFTQQMYVAEDGITGLRTLLARQRQLDELDAAKAHAEAVTAAAADRMRAGIDFYADADLAPAREFMEVVREDQAAADRHAAAIEAAGQGGTAIGPGRLRVIPEMLLDQRGRALNQAITAALDGDAARIAAALILLGGWQPPDPAALDEFVAAQAAEAAERKAAADAEGFTAMTGGLNQLAELGHRNRARVAASLAGKPVPPGEVPIGRDNLPIRMPVQRQWQPGIGAW